MRITTMPSARRTHTTGEIALACTPPGSPSTRCLSGNGASRRRLPASSAAGRLSYFWLRRRICQHNVYLSRYHAIGLHRVWSC